MLKCKDVVDDIKGKVPRAFMVDELEVSLAVQLQEPVTEPYATVLITECSRMNKLCREVTRSLVELKLGLDGKIDMSPPLYAMMTAINKDVVPGRNRSHPDLQWDLLAWPSTMSLSKWFLDLLRRYKQLQKWQQELEMPLTIWLGGLFSPSSFLTAIRQSTARELQLPIDTLTLETYVTSFQMPDNKPIVAPEGGAYIHGLVIQGAKWMGADDEDFITVGNTQTGGCLEDATVKELTDDMPVLYVRAMRVQPEWTRTAVGYLRNNDDVFECPVYNTSQRGSSFVFMATLGTMDPKAKWIKAGVALLLSADE